MRNILQFGLTATALAVAHPAFARTFTPEDLVQFNRLGGSSVSADGGMLIFSLAEPDLEANARPTDLWLLDLREPGSVAERWRQTADVNEGSPVFSADGTEIYYLSDESGSSQVWRAPVGEGDPVSSN